ncbi:MAG: hypothetical protein ACRDA3_12565 [Peptostreptococcaceae bacterium]
MKTKQIPVRLDIDLYEQMQERIKELDRSFNSYVKQLIKEDLKKGGNK